MLRPVSVLTVTNKGYFFVRSARGKSQEFIGNRNYEIIVVDRGSKDGTVEWLKQQPDVVLAEKRQ